MSGIEVNEEIILPHLKRMTNNSKNDPIRYLILKINEKCTQVVVDCEGNREKNWEDFKEELLQKRPCYAIFDLQYHNKKNGIETNKLITILWSGNASNGKDGIKEKMLIASTIKTVQQNLSLNGGTFQAGNEQELEYQNVLDFANRF